MSQVLFDCGAYDTGRDPRCQGPSPLYFCRMSLHCQVVPSAKTIASGSVAELAIGMMIFMARNTFAGGTGSELKGKTLGIHAYGNVGRLVGLLGKAFGMNVIAFDPFVKRENVEKDGVGYVETIEDLYKKANYISLHIPANDKKIGRAHV